MMEWMHTHQLSSKNLTAGEKLAMTMELQKEIALENKKRKKRLMNNFMVIVLQKIKSLQSPLQLECSLNLEATLGQIRKQQRRLERLYGIQNGSTSFQGNQYEVVTNKSEAPKKTQEQLAAQMGISVDTLQNYKILSEMIPELEELLDTGVEQYLQSIIIIVKLYHNKWR